MSFLIVIAASAALGSILLHRLHASSYLETWCFRLLAGVCAVAILSFVFGHGSLFWTQTLLALIALLGLAGTGMGHLQNRSGSNNAPRVLPTPPAFTLLEFLAIAAIAGALLLTLADALSPAIQADAVTKYLATASDYAREGRIGPVRGNPYTSHGHWAYALYAVAYFPGREIPAALLGWTFGILACASVFILGQRIGGRRCGLLAAAMLASAPVYMDQAGGVAIDLALCALATTALTAWLAWTEKGKPGWLLLSGALAGSACGIRPMGIAVCIALALASFIHPAAPSRRQALWFLLAAGLALGPWWAHTAYFTGNPFFPWRLGSSPLDNGIPALLRNLIRFPYEVIMRPVQFDGWMRSPGIMVLALGIPGLVLGGAKARWLGAYAITGGLFAFFFASSALSLLPFCAAMFIVAALAYEKLPRMQWPLGALILFVWMAGLALQAAYLSPKIAVLTGRQTRDTYLSATVDRYPAFQFANNYLNDGGKILALDTRCYYLLPPAFSNTAALRPLVSWPLERQARWLARNDIRYVMLPVTYLRESRELTPVVPMLNQWRSSPAFFQLIAARDDPRPGGGLDRVEFYRVVAPED